MIATQVSKSDFKNIDILWSTIWWHNSQEHFFGITLNQFDGFLLYMSWIGWNQLELDCTSK